MVRLLGAGRLAIEIPADWPVEVDAAQVVRRSTVVLPDAHTAAAFVWTPVDGAVSVTLDHFPPRPVEQPLHRSGRGAERVLLESGDEVVTVAGVRHAPDGGDSHAFVGLTAPTLGGRFTISGPAGDVQRIAATAQLVPDGQVAVPNVLVGIDPLTLMEHGAPSLEERARRIIEAAGLVFDSTHPLKPGGGKRRRIVLDGTRPTGGTVLATGSTVTARFVRAR
ncbi:hypothetical protein [Solicola sp. PLA-1-18]|uniref:hypothetical protein n=1 Tax=Solicola sp. PLA-1-18 TaxID=3380532 RepID=UPI003B80B5F6